MIAITCLVTASGAFDILLGARKTCDRNYMFSTIRLCIYILWFLTNNNILCVTMCRPNSMYMWCPDNIGRESWHREGQASVSRPDPSFLNRVLPSRAEYSSVHSIISCGEHGIL